MSAVVQDLLVRKSIVVKAPRAHVFKVFTERHDAWWPRSHHIGRCERFVAKMEPFVGGRWFEQGEDGSECEWGRVLAWEPHARVLLSWEISADWRHDPAIANEVEVLFVAESEALTRVELEHRRIERYGDQAEAMQAVFASDGGWPGILAALAATAELPG